MKSKVGSAVQDYYLSLGFQLKRKLWFEHDIAADKVGGIIVKLRGRDSVEVQAFPHIAHIAIVEAWTELWDDRIMGDAHSHDPSKRRWTAHASVWANRVESEEDIPTAIQLMEEAREFVWGLDPAGVLKAFERGEVNMFLSSMYFLHPLYAAYVGAKEKALEALRKYYRIHKTPKSRRLPYEQFARGVMQWAGWDEEELEWLRE